jgi:Rrf2 family protein
MSVSARVHYGCIGLLELAVQYRMGRQSRVKVVEIARRHGIRTPFLRQVFLRLKIAGLVEGARGSGGGYTLARSPEEISLRDVLDAVNYPWRLAPDAKSSWEDPACFVLMRAWTRINRRLEQELSAITLDHLAEEYVRATETHVTQDWII